MLAQIRQRQKFSVNPRGTEWINDESKFGQKLMERMGWSKGKGLGPNEDGRKESVTVKFKNDTKGVGCTKAHADSWIGHQDDFNSLLANLNSSVVPKEETVKVTQLEKKSKSSRKRVHYQKFTKGKDLSARSVHDMNCIFGIKESKLNSECKVSQEDNRQESTDDTETVENTGLVTVTSTSSIQEYFAQKMAVRLKNVPQTNYLDECDQEATSTTDPVEDSNGAGENSKDTDEVNNYPKRKKKKSKKSKSEKNNDIVDDTVSFEASTPMKSFKLDEVTTSKSKKKKKKNYDKEESTESERLQERSSCKKRKQKSHSAEMNDLTCETNHEFDAVEESDGKNRTSTGPECPTKSKKKKKEKKKSKTSNEATSDIGNTETVKNDEQILKDLSVHLTLKKKDDSNSGKNMLSTKNEIIDSKLTKNEEKYVKAQKKRSRRKKLKSVKKDNIVALSHCTLNDSHVKKNKSESSNVISEKLPVYFNKFNRIVYPTNNEYCKIKQKQKVEQLLMAKEVAKVFNGSNLDLIPGYGDLMV